jgi:hypothetical protein
MIDLNCTLLAAHPLNELASDDGRALRFNNGSFMSSAWGAVATAPHARVAAAVLYTIGQMRDEMKNQPPVCFYLTLNEQRYIATPFSHVFAKIAAFLRGDKTARWGFAFFSQATRIDLENAVGFATTHYRETQFKVILPWHLPKSTDLRHLHSYIREVVMRMSGDHDPEISKVRLTSRQLAGIDFTKLTFLNKTWTLNEAVSGAWLQWYKQSFPQALT